MEIEKTDMSEKEYLRDSNYSTEPGLESDVLAEQTKINSADAIVFIYPVFWTEASAKLVGWFDRQQLHHAQTTSVEHHQRLCHATSI